MTKKERRQVYSDEMKLRILCRKINADFLEATRQLINVDLTRTPVTMTFAQALASFRNEVNRKFPPSLTPAERTRRMAEIDTSYNRNRGGRGGRGGRGRGRFRGRDRRSNRDDKNSGTESVRTIQGLDGKAMEVHPSYNFSEEDWQNIPYEEKGRLIQARQDYHSRKRARVSEVQRERHQANQQDTPLGGGYIMGGKNEQEALRKTGTPNERGRA